MAKLLTEDDRAALRSFAPTAGIVVDGLGAVLVCHGSPRSDEEILTPQTPAEQLREALAGVAEPVVVGGHVHRQHDIDVDGRRLVNAGSIGMPDEELPGAYWALLGPDIELRRTEYDAPAPRFDSIPADERRLRRRRRGHRSGRRGRLCAGRGPDRSSSTARARR